MAPCKIQEPNEEATIPIQMLAHLAPSIMRAIMEDSKNTLPDSVFASVTCFLFRYLRGWGRKEKATKAEQVKNWNKLQVEDKVCNTISTQCRVLQEYLYIF
jgi:hypothetical protein